MPPPEGAPARRSEDRPIWPLVVAGVAVLALVASLIFNVVQARRTAELAEEVEALEIELAAARERIEELAAAGEDADAGDDGGLLDGLGGGLDELLEGLGGEGGFGDLFDDLFGGQGGEGLDELLEGLDGGGQGQADLLGCLTSGAQPGSLSAPTDESPAEQVQIVAEQVEELRELSFDIDVDPTFMGDQEFEQTVFELFGEDYTAEDADLEARVLIALGALERGGDLRELYLDLISQQAAGFYNTETKEIVVRTSDPDESLSLLTLLTLAHELQHALADQSLGLPSEAELSADSDAGLAALAVVEGDAVLFQQQYALAALDFQQYAELAQDPLVLESQEQLQSYPHFLQRELLFPYEDGLTFACDLYVEGGWDAVDAAHEAPPTTTAEVLDPERYRSGDAGSQTPALGGPGGAFTAALTDTFGAAELQWLFEAPGDDPGVALENPAAAAAAWDGGELRLWTDGDATALGLSLAQRDGEADLCDSLSAWHDAAFPDADDAGAEGDERLAVEGADQAGVITCADGGVRLGVAPTLDGARAIAG